MEAKSILILGAASNIGHAIARGYAALGYDLIFAARNVERLKVANGARCIEFDVLDIARYPNFIDALGIVPDIVVCVVGLLGNQKTAEGDTALAEVMMRSNYLGPAQILGIVANHMEQRGSGMIIGISSVAGDRGRASNYIYGSAKAGFTAFLSGLRNRLAATGVHVMTVKPGFVETRMTAGMKLPKLLTASPQELATAILKAAERKSDVIYFYPIWRLIMLIIRHIPESLFKKMHL